jgi:hypothetical protein
MSYGQISLNAITIDHNVYTTLGATFHGVETARKDLIAGTAK